MSKLRHEESGKFNKVPSHSIKTVPGGGQEGTKVIGVRFGNEMGATVKMDFTGDSSSMNRSISNDLGPDTSSGENVGVKRNLSDGNSAPSASVRNLPPNSNLRGRNNKNWDVMK